MILRELKEMDNKQLYNFTREQTQVFLTARLGDGCISQTNSSSVIYTTNCKHLEYLMWKKQLISCYSYKLWSSETIQKWSKLQEKLKSTDKELSCRQLAYKWKSL